jgi:hypothetical protein
VTCPYATSTSEKANSCGLGMYRGIPSKGVCNRCVERGENNEEFAKNQKAHSVTPPTLPQIASSLASSVGEWAKAGLPVATSEQLDSRMAICKSCEFWDQSGFAGTGRCKKCGCSTQAKLRMSTSKCPIDKWGPVEVRQSD